MRDRALPYFAHLTLESSNAKTGPIPVSVTRNNTCPVDCSFKGNGCYAETGPMGLHWAKVNSGERGMPWEMFCDAVDTILPMQIWRHNAAGDLPGDGRKIDHFALGMLLDASFGKRGFTYTHYSPMDPDNAIAIKLANRRGLTTNISADSLEKVDAVARLGIGPVVCVLPSDTTKNQKTPDGRTVVVCPATVRDHVSCATCQLCYQQRDTVVGFPAHGQSHRRIDIRLLQQRRAAPAEGRKTCTT